MFTSCMTESLMVLVLPFTVEWMRLYIPRPPIAGVHSASAAWPSFSLFKQRPGLWAEYAPR